jgi:hypothetical protein
VDFEYLFPAYPQGIFIPQAENEIVVKYDNRIPVRVFGGDTWINESIWAVKDKEYTKGGENIDESTLDEFNGIGDFRLNVAWPFKRFEINERHFIIKNATAGVGKIQDENVYNVNPTGIKPSSLRQLIAMWTAETKINLSFSFNDEGVLHSSLQQLPLKNYVMRPHQWDDDQFASGATAAYADNNIFADYETDYGDEYLNWQFGGYRFLPQVNLDYSKKDNTRAIASVPELGFEEQNEFCTRIIWSARRPINVQDTPSIRTFPTQNVHDISDDTGEIKYAYDAISDKGNNLYAFTDSGVAILLIDKRLIHEINGTELATVGSDIGGILNELWLNKEIGMTDELWRSAGEYSNIISWMNDSSVYTMAGNSILDIGRKGYHSHIKREFLDKLGTGYADKVAGLYNVLNNEYWCNTQFKTPEDTDRPTIVFNQAKQQWEGTFAYDFDRYLSFNNNAYGLRDLETYHLDQGRIINGSLVEAYLIQASAVVSLTTGFSKTNISDKEFIRIRINSDNKPTKVEFFDDLSQLIANNVQCEIDTIANPDALRDYYGFEHYIPRRTVNRNRMQGRLLIFKIIHNLDEDFKVVTTDIQYKPLK